MIEAIAQSLMLRVYHEVSAIVSIGKREELLDVFLFDTYFAQSWMRVHPDAEKICLITNHPEGRCTLYHQDRENIRLLQELKPCAKLQVFVSGEDIGVVEAEL